MCCRNITSRGGTSIPVSYTHLDVYKRQAVFMPGEGALAVITARVSLRCPGSVSYTHLAVYQRQIGAFSGRRGFFSRGLGGRRFFRRCSLGRRGFGWRFCRRNFGYGRFGWRRLFDRGRGRGRCFAAAASSHDHHSDDQQTQDRNDPYSCLLYTSRCV